MHARCRPAKGRTRSCAMLWGAAAGLGQQNLTLHKANMRHVWGRRSWARSACPRRTACAPCSPTRATRSRPPSSRCRATTPRTRWRAAPLCFPVNPNFKPMPSSGHGRDCSWSVRARGSPQALPCPAEGMQQAADPRCQAAPRPDPLEVGWGQRLRRGRAGSPEQGVGEPHVPAVRAAQPLARGHREAPVHAQPDLALPGPAVAAGLLRRGADRQLRAVQASPAQPLPCTRTRGCKQVIAHVTERQAVHKQYLFIRMSRMKLSDA